MKLGCLIGFHKWKTLDSPPGNADFEICQTCNKKRIVIYAMMESDLKKWLDSGQITQAGYDAAIRDGFFTKGVHDLIDNNNQQGEHNGNISSS